MSIRKPENQIIREQQAKDAPVALGDYRRARERVLARMLELRSQRLRKEVRNKNGLPHSGGPKPA
jgi:hypothetical protein